ncbi:hypothetical protein BGZ82_010369 [Podila clonocystis]|nr:hypothetical protein BGZ82_010369 [Podila clonocystis]
MTIFTTSITEDAASIVITADMDHSDLTTLKITIDDQAWNIITTTGGDPVQRWDTQLENIMMEPTTVIQKHHLIQHRTHRHNPQLTTLTHPIKPTQLTQFTPIQQPFTELIQESIQ